MELFFSTFKDDENIESINLNYSLTILFKISKYKCFQKSDPLNYGLPEIAKTRLLV
jgi:hypothetical protein